MTIVQNVNNSRNVDKDKMLIVFTIELNFSQCREFYEVFSCAELGIICRPYCLTKCLFLRVEIEWGGWFTRLG